MSRPRVPQAVLDAAHARKAARLARDWAEADRLRAVIEAAGWRVVDRGPDFALRPAHPGDVVEAGRVRFGTSDTVASRLAEPASARATLIVRVTDDGLSAARMVESLRSYLHGDVHLVLVADAPEDAAAAALDRVERDAALGASLEVAWTSQRLGPAAALNIGLRRSRGTIVVLVSPALALTGDPVAPVEAALADPTVAVAGGGGLSGRGILDLRPAPAGDVVALDGRWLGFRRGDAISLLPVDERLQSARYVAVALSLGLREAGSDGPPRRALDLGLGAVAETRDGESGAVDGEQDRLERRDRYRLLDRFRSRVELFEPPGA